MNNDLTAQFLSLRKEYIESTFGQLNPMQKQAAGTTEGALLILAGAGSGKTTVLVNRIACMVRFGCAATSDKIYGTVTAEHIAELKMLIKTGGTPSASLEPLLSVSAVKPYHILAITFTNKAAGELKKRLETRLGAAGSDINASTFHSACVRILRREAGRLGYPQSFTIYDSDDQTRAMKDVFKTNNIDDKFLPIKAALSGIGRLKDKMISPEQALATNADSRAGLIARVYAAYTKKLQSAGAMDFDDLIYLTVKLLQTEAEVREYYQKRFKYILVDEYQDTSVAQFQMVNLLGNTHGNVCVVGDDDQSIYRFRGATIENILNFEDQFHGALVIRLEQNYRSTSNILDAANCVIKNNVGRKGKTLWTQEEGGAPVIHYTADSEFDEAAYIATTIGKNLRNGAKLRDHAVLYRMNAQSGPIETYFARAGIPYKIVGGQRFFDRKEIRDMVAYMSIVVNRQDDLRLRRIINEPTRKIGAATVDNIASIANGLGICMLDVIEHAPDYPVLGRALSALANFYRIYNRLLASYESETLDGFVSEIMGLTGYQAMLVAAGEEGQTRLENIGQLISSVKTYADQHGEEASLPGFLEEVALISDLDSYDEESDVVILMTMHAAKGLEFDFVFVVGLEDGIFPSEMSRYSEEDLEEERRLCYVGITRAKKELYLSSANTRMLFGQTKHNRPSRFLEEIAPELLKEECSPAAAQTKSSRERYQAQQNSYVQQGYTSHSTVGAGTPSNLGRQTERQATNRSVLSGGQGAMRTKPQQSSFAPQFHAGSAAAPVKTAGGASYKAGDVVDHKVFGRGQVLKVTPVAGDTIVEIRFDTAGVKKTMANYAPLKHAEN